MTDPLAHLETTQEFTKEQISIPFQNLGVCKRTEKPMRFGKQMVDMSW